MEDWDPAGSAYNYLQTKRDGSKDRMPLDRSGDVSRQIRILEQKMEKLLLLFQALWETLRDETGATEESVLERVRALENEARTRPCPSCSRPVAKKNAKCLYCGKSVPAQKDLFDL